MKLKDCIYPLPHYPDDGKYLKCGIDLPCSVEKGFDCCVIGKYSEHKMTKRHLWYVYWNGKLGIKTTKGYKTLEKAVTEAFDEYLKWLEFEKERVIKYRKELEE